MLLRLISTKMTQNLNHTETAQRMVSMPLRMVALLLNLPKHLESQKMRHKDYMMHFGMVTHPLEI